MKRKWTMTLKKYSFKHLRRLPCGERMKKGRPFHQESEKAFTWLQFDESQQTTFAVFKVNLSTASSPLRNAISKGNSTPPPPLSHLTCWRAQTCSDQIYLSHSFKSVFNWETGFRFSKSKSGFPNRTWNSKTDFTSEKSVLRVDFN